MRFATLALTLAAGVSAVAAASGSTGHAGTAGTHASHSHGKAKAVAAGAAVGVGAAAAAGAAVAAAPSKAASKAVAPVALAADAAPTAFVYGKVSSTYPGVRGSNKNGPTNPKNPSLGTKIDQSSDSRLASVNSVDDWCTFGPAGTDQPIGDVEGETVAWCTKARNGARVIPDGTLTAVHFVKTPLYVQIMALGDFTRIGLMAGDEGGELDPHGATNMGNPVGGNVTSNVTGTDVFYEEWMNYISYNQVCFRVCIAAGSGISTTDECEHQLDVMGCNFVMPGNYADGVFETCDGDAAYPPGRYPLGDGSFSTFHQYFVGSYTGADGAFTSYTNGAEDQMTPTAAYSLPATSNCVPTASIANGIAAILPATTAAPSASGSGSGTGSSSSNTKTKGSSGSGSSGSSSSGGSGGSSGAQSTLGGAGVFVGPLALALVAVLAGAAIL
ncbi:unnamed protein product [Tilletia controversa]|uniref:Macrofage activating glycoprotein n=1 Tax=Tilletia controversa TaxID=13291 RepID=A0A8X7MRP2_9BASI|nr:hypothetical protein CF328_g6058 [Tilletia controversa]KAE8247016.1 hypothetical protein A4X06_0g4759 [Tilletia controversa]CAD6938728.1 unnamed protein product [Tilletia controversa]CAD6953583.1 unnamed protein product [Tilletia controversa]